MGCLCGIFFARTLCQGNMMYILSSLKITVPSIEIKQEILRVRWDDGGGASLKLEQTEFTYHSGFIKFEVLSKMVGRKY